jgi:hypothetical protein
MTAENYYYERGRFFRQWNRPVAGAVVELPTDLGAVSRLPRNHSDRSAHSILISLIAAWNAISENISTPRCWKISVKPGKMNL